MKIFSLGKMSSYSAVRTTLTPALAVASAFFSNVAMADTDLTADVAISAGGSSNPFLLSGPTTTVGSLTASISPHLIITDDLTKFRLDAATQLTRYSKIYPRNDSFNLTGTVERQISPSAQLRGRLGFSSSISGTADSFFLIPNQLDGTNSIPIIQDVNINGTTVRRRSFSGGIGFSQSFSKNDSIDLSADVIAARFGGGSSINRQEFNYYSQSVGYNRQLNDRTSIGGQVSFGEADYLGGRLGDSTIITPMFTVSHKVSSAFKLDAGLGGSFSRVNNLVGRTNSSSLAARLNMCYQGEAQNLCFGVLRSSLPSTSNGVRTQTSFNMGYSYILNQKDSLTANASYARAGTSILGASGPVEFVSGGGAFNHKFTDRISGFARGSYSNTLQSGVYRKPSIQAGIGISLRLGGNR
jgi:hypothetical protein